MGGLSKKTITVKSRKGKTFQRTIMARAGDSAKKTVKRVGGFVNRHKGKIAGAAALAGAAYLGHKHGIRAVDVARAAARIPAAHREGAAKAAKFHKSAVASGWAKKTTVASDGFDKGMSAGAWSHRTVRHAAKGYAQGFRSKMRSSR